MRYTKITVAVAAAGAGVICLAPASAADDTATKPDTVVAPGPSTITVGPKAPVPGRMSVQIIPCVRVGVPRQPTVEIIPCVRVGSGSVRVVPGVSADANPPDPVRAGDGSVAVG